MTNDFVDLASETVVSQEVEEEEEKDSSELIVNGNLSPPQQIATQISESRRNPPRNHRPLDRLTYK